MTTSQIGIMLKIKNPSIYNRATQLVRIIFIDNH